MLYLDATKWSTVLVSDGSWVYVNEMIIKAPSKSIDVCVCCATTGSPFISTLELRPLNLSMYATEYEDEFYLKVATRVNFGALSQDALRYPDDPYDRIWSSDQENKQNYLEVASGTERISTKKYVDANTRDYPPVKVMQTGIVGTLGNLTFRLQLEDLPAQSQAYLYLAEIEDLASNDTRKFKMIQPSNIYSYAVVNIAENANGSYTLFEAICDNVTLDFVLTFSFKATRDSTRSPLLNAIEISKYVQIAAKTDVKDASALSAIKSMSKGSNWAVEKGDPCVPAAWEWVTCGNTLPPRITKIVLSGKNVQGEIPPELKNMIELTELWLDGNHFTGPIPDISHLFHLKILHLENNRLTGPIPPYIGMLPSLKEIYVQNNSLSGDIPPSLFVGKDMFRFEDNAHLKMGGSKRRHNRMVLGMSMGMLAFLVVILGIIIVLQYIRR